MCKQFFDGIKPQIDIEFDQFAIENYYLPRESGNEGAYNISHVPYFNEIADTLSPNHPAQEITLLKGVQMGATVFGIGVCFYWLARYPSSILIVCANVEKARQHSEKKIQPAIEESKLLSELIAQPRDRDSRNRILSKAFPGGVLELCGPNSTASASGDTFRYLMLDDVDRWSASLGVEGSTVDLFKNRTEAFGSRRKIFISGTPSIVAISNLLPCYTASSQGRFEINCPNCSDMIELRELYCKFEEDKNAILRFSVDNSGYEFEFFQNPEDESVFKSAVSVTTAWAVCKSCNHPINESQKGTSASPGFLHSGKYHHKYPSRVDLKPGFRVNSLYSPIGMSSWRKIADEFCAGLFPMENVEKIKACITTKFATAWDEKAEHLTASQLKKLCDDFELWKIPENTKLITAGADVHKNRIDCVAISWSGSAIDARILGYFSLYGNPMDEQIWIDLQESISKIGNGIIPIFTAIDSGYMTQAVYAFILAMNSPFFITTKGVVRESAPIISAPSKAEVDFKGKIGGVEVWPVGTHEAKKFIFSLLDPKRRDENSRILRLSKRLINNFFDEMAAEKLVKTTDKDGRTKEKWKLISRNNHALDCCVYSLANAMRLGIMRMNDNQKTVPNKSKKQNKKKNIKPERW